MTTAKTNNPTTVPGISKPPADVSPALRKYLESLSEAIEIRLGRRGDPRDRAITLRELIESGLATELAGRPFNPNGTGGGPTFQPAYDSTVPPTPTGFTANGGYAIVTLFWDYPKYGPHAHTEIWRNSANVIGDAQLVGISSGLSFVDPVGEGASFYYWIRHVSTSEVYGQFNAANGTLAQTALNVTLLLDTLNGAISESELTTALGTRISLIDADANTVNSVAYRIAQETAARVAAINDEIAARTADISAVTQDISDLTDAIDLETLNRTTAITNEAAARAAAIDSAIDTLQAQINDLSAVAEYDNFTTYITGELVTYNGFLYRAKSSTTGNLPTNTTYWELLGEYSSLADIVNQNAAAIVQINTVDATSTSAASQAIQAVTATVNNPTTGLAATASALESLSSAVNDSETGLSATVTRVSGLEATVNDPVTGVDATSSALDLVETTVNNETTGVVATANRVSTLESSVNNPETGLAATRATLLTDYYTKAGVDSAISTSSTQLTSAINLKNRTYRQNDEPAASGLVIGDLWFDSNDGNKSYRWNGTAWVATDDTRIAGTISNLTTNYYTIAGTDAAIAGASLTLQSQIDNKNRTYNQASAPSSGLSTGDLWFDTDDNNKSYRWNGTSWVAVDDARIESTAADLASNYYTKTSTDEAIAAATLDLVSTTSLNTALGEYVSNSTLTQNYYTITDTDQAISNATLGLVSTTDLNTTLGEYVSNSTLTQNYYTITDTDQAISNATFGLVSNTDLNTALGGYVTNSTLTQNYYTISDTNEAISTATQNLASSADLDDYVTTATLDSNYYTKTAVDEALSAQTTTLTSKINSKNATYKQSTAPVSNLVAGDLWFDGNNKAHRWNGTSWIATDDVRIDQTISNLSTNYYTISGTNSAIAAASSTLESKIDTKNKSFYQSSAPSSTGLIAGDLWFDSNKKSYRWSGTAWVAVDDARIASTASNLATNYYTKTDTNSAISAATSSLVSTSALNTALGSYVTTSTLTENYYTKASVDDAISSASTTLQTAINGNTSSIETQATSIDGLSAQYTVKVDVNGYVAGFGLASTPRDGTPFSEFTVRADRFTVASPTPPVGSRVITPFVVQATTQVINGITVPAGVYMDAAYIKNGTITNVKIGNGEIDNAKIANLSADKINAGSLDAARITIDTTVLDTYFDAGTGKHRLYVPNARIDNAQIKDLAVDTLKIAGNSITIPLSFSAANVYVNEVINLGSGGTTCDPVYVGPNQGEYVFSYIDPITEEEVYDYVGFPNGDFNYVCTTTDPTFTSSMTVLETPWITVGDVTDGGSIIVFYATMDAGTTQDAGQHIYMLVDKNDGNGYQIVANTVAGTRTSGGDTYASIPMAVSTTVTGLSMMKVKILTGTRRVDLPAGTFSSPSTLRNISLSILGARR